MSMIWDAPLTAAVGRELEARLLGARLRAVGFHWESRELLLFFRSQTLRWSLHPRAGWMALEPPLEPPENSRRLSADLAGVEALPDERLLRFLFRKTRGRTRSLQVVVELMTNQWNALLLEGEEEWIRHLLWTRGSGSRVLAVGRAYEAPPRSGRRGVERVLTEEEWEEFVRGQGQAEVRSAALETIAFTSPLNLPALFPEASEGEIPGTRLEAGHRLWLRLRSLERPQPCILETAGGYQPYPFILEGFAYKEFPSILEAIGAVSGELELRDGSLEGVLQWLDRGLEKARGRVRAIEREMTRATDPEELRQRANLLLARLGELKRGGDQVTLKGFDGQETVVSLDPSLSPRENAEALYKEAARQDRALERLPQLLEKARARVGEMSLLREKLLAGEIASAEGEQGIETPKREGEKRGTGKEPRLPYVRYRSSGGLEIRVGRGSGENDALTFQHARPNDVWLHAREASGAHVILRWVEEEAPPARDLTEAAVLAALNSRARGAGVVPVDWTRRKYVRKPRKAPPGSVLPDRTRTLFVQPDPELPNRLGWED